MNLMFCKEECLRGGGFLLPLLAQGPILPVLLISLPIRFPLSLVPIMKTQARGSARAHEVLDFT